MLERIKELLAEYLQLDKNSITPESDIVKDLGADSLTLVELMFVLEEESGITIPNELVDKLSKVGDLAEYVDKNKKKK